MFVRTENPAVNGFVNGGLIAFVVVTLCFFASRFGVPAFCKEIDGNQAASICGLLLLGAGVWLSVLLTTKPRYPFERLFGCIISFGGLLAGTVAFLALYYIFR